MSEVELSGCLQKCSNWRGKWNKRWFVLHGTKLHYFTSKPVSSLNSPKGSYVVTNAGPTPEKGLPFLLLIRTSGGGVLRLNAQSEAERDSWVDAVTAAALAAVAALPPVEDIPAAIARLRELLRKDEFVPASPQYTTTFEHDCPPNGGLSNFGIQAKLCERYSAYLTDGLLERMILGNRIGGLAETKAYLLQHLQWRIDYKCDEILREGFSALEANAFVNFAGRAKDGLPTMVFRVNRLEPKLFSAEQYTRYLVSLMERATRENPAVRFHCLFDCQGFKMKHANMKFFKAAAKALGDNYPEMMVSTFIFPVGAAIRKIWKGARSFMDPSTAVKIVMFGVDFRETLLEYYDADQLEPRHGGTLKLAGTHSSATAATETLKTEVNDENINDIDLSKLLLHDGDESSTDLRVE